MHRKYHQGQFREGHWIFVGIEVGTPKGFMVVCPNNRSDATTLLPLIQLRILLRSIISSDMWAAYTGGIAAMQQGYQHQTVNHSLHLVDPATGVHTQNIEGH